MSPGSKSTPKRTKPLRKHPTRATAKNAARTTGNGKKTRKPWMPAPDRRPPIDCTVLLPIRERNSIDDTAICRNRITQQTLLLHRITTGIGPSSTVSVSNDTTITITIKSKTLAAMAITKHNKTHEDILPLHSNDFLLYYHSE
mmetsp:Transcript_23742/g.52529  ORF Transcript_23742/g.52529 Transcript_23742/m.52529 type:complete len:143 (-) Transcript_23742:134-562(-)